MALLYLRGPKQLKADGGGLKHQGCRREEQSSNNHLPQLLQHQGEDPEVEHELRRSGPEGRRRAEVQQEHVGEEEEEGEVHDDVAEEDGDRSAPEAAPAAEQEAPPDGGAALSRRTSR